MTPWGLRGRRAVLGIVAAAALAAGGTAAVAAASAGGVSAHGVSASGVSAHGATVHRTASTAQVRAALVRYLSTSRPLANVASGGGLKPGSPDSTAGSRGSAQVGSYNWSGYADTASPGTFTAVSATWRQPATICSPEQRLTSTWVGLDGFSDSTVEQDGTLAWCFEGQAAYYTWWEMYPGGTVTVGSAVRPGDLIKASVTESGGNYTLSVGGSQSPVEQLLHRAGLRARRELPGQQRGVDCRAAGVLDRHHAAVGLHPVAGLERDADRERHQGEHRLRPGRDRDHDGGCHPDLCPG